MTRVSVGNLRKKKEKKKIRRLPSEIPPGLTLQHTLSGHIDVIRQISWSPNGLTLASGSKDKTIMLWDSASGELKRKLEGHEEEVWGISWSPDGLTLASGSLDKTIRLWDITSGMMKQKFEGRGVSVNGMAWSPDSQRIALATANGVLIWDPDKVGIMPKQPPIFLSEDTVLSLSWSPDGQMIATGSIDNTIRLWDIVSGMMKHKLEGHKGTVFDVSWSPDGRLLASGSEDKTIRLWDAKDGRLLHILEGHTGSICPVRFSADGCLLASKGFRGDNTVRLWRTKTAELLGILYEPSTPLRTVGLAFHPSELILAKLAKKDKKIHLWQIDYEALLGVEPIVPTEHYINAKVVLVGDSGVGKTGLGLVLTGQLFKPTESTHGRHVWTMESTRIQLPSNRYQTRETLLWDLAGQPGYRIIHQLHLNEVAVALVVFDARSETDPLAGVRHWDRALRLARQRQGAQAIPIRKFLVSARADRGGVPVSKARIEALKEEYGLDGYFETSSKTGLQIKELIETIREAIPWEDLPIVASSEIFASIKKFILEVKKVGRLLITANELYRDFVAHDPEMIELHQDSRAQFDTCIGLLEHRDLIRRLSFGGYVLLQPELLDAYASAMVIAAKNEPDGLGSILEEDALVGRFPISKDERVADKGQEQLLLYATVEELVGHDLALRETAEDGRFLVFPSQFNREYEDAPEPPGTAIIITFEGPVQSIYATLAVRLSHSGWFEISRTEMWRNAAIYTARAGGKCGIYLREFIEAKGQLTLFFDDQASDETRFHFEEYLLAHLNRRAIEGTIKVKRFFICQNCGTPVPDVYVEKTLERDENQFRCGCGEQVSLIEPKEKLTKRFPSAVEAMDKAADSGRDFETSVMSARAETTTRNFVKWAGGKHVTLAIVFTDIVGSTALGQELGDEGMGQVRQAHFAKGRQLLPKFKGREIKTIGDSLMVAFHSVGEALDFVLAFKADTGHKRIQIRAGIHIGPLLVEGEDTFGGTVNFASRVVGAIKGAEIGLSEQSKKDVDQLGSARHRYLEWNRHEGIEMKGFPGKFILWSLAVLPY
jgi:WD40 repeat protein/class 3 adenylate cyclase